jgi:hypothetical protein
MRKGKRRGKHQKKGGIFLLAYSCVAAWCMSGIERVTAALAGFQVVRGGEIPLCLSRPGR